MGLEWYLIYLNWILLFICQTLNANMTASSSCQAYIFGIWHGANTDTSKKSQFYSTKINLVFPILISTIGASPVFTVVHK